MWFCARVFLLIMFLSASSASVSVSASPTLSARSIRIAGGTVSFTSCSNDSTPTVWNISCTAASDDDPLCLGSKQSNREKNLSLPFTTLVALNIRTQLAAEPTTPSRRPFITFVVLIHAPDAGVLLITDTPSVLIPPTNPLNPARAASVAIALLFPPSLLSHSVSFHNTNHHAQLTRTKLLRLLSLSLSYQILSVLNNSF
mmetsp:Transcript_7730/g.16529  ORF Transcript_7730/g.16529 Transcript_7730/m.16529 type:complete len:200 (+) Transcript_7730:1339-1938(+)